ncbi:MAG: lactate utilization protein [Nitrososphaerales archaeon]|jgi:L-lactate dehydrogenase complex protein LldG
MQDYTDELSSLGTPEVFFAALRDNHTVPHTAGDAKSTVDILKTITGESDARSVVAGGLPVPAKMLVEAGLKGTKHSFVEDLEPSKAVGVISKADVGISWARYGAAKEGALVELAYDDAVKLVSSLPRVSVFLLSSKNLCPDVSSAFTQIAEVLRSAGEIKPVVSVISGPSKTADIELRLLYGVHGPHELHVLLLDWI